MDKIRRKFTTLMSVPFSNEKVRREYFIELVDYYPRLADWYLTAEPETWQWLVDNVRKNWTCLEVGGHVGETALLLSQIGARTISFEPNKVSAEMFRNNVEYNQNVGNGDYLDIELITRPIGQYDGIAAEKLYFAGKDNQAGETYGEFNFLTLDRFVRMRDDIMWVSLIFSDADGWDYDVVLGAETVIKKFRPYIILEVNYAWGWRGYNAEHIYKWAELHDYEYKFLDASMPTNMLFIPMQID